MSNSAAADSAETPIAREALGITGYFRVLATFLRNSLVREMTFRANFVIQVITRAFWFFAQIALFQIIFSRVPEINGWTRMAEELPRTYSSLHANILDQFHEHNVEITSPAFRAIRDGNESTIPAA